MAALLLQELFASGSCTGNDASSGSCPRVQSGRSRKAIYGSQINPGDIVVVRYEMKRRQVCAKCGGYGSCYRWDGSFQKKWNAGADGRFSWCYFQVLCGPYLEAAKGGDLSPS